MTLYGRGFPTVSAFGWECCGTGVVAAAAASLSPVARPLVGVRPAAAFAWQMGGVGCWYAASVVCEWGRKATWRMEVIIGMMRGRLRGAATRTGAKTAAPHSIWVFSMPYRSRLPLSRSNWVSAILLW